MNESPAPRKKTGGRKPGVLNQSTRDVKAKILKALDMVGGEKYLAQVARTHPAAFIALVGKVLPMQVRADITDFTYVIQRLEVSAQPVPGVISNGLPQPPRLVAPKVANDG
jgi:hypothetical protein